jgi:hypothetical protein
MSTTITAVADRSAARFWKPSTESAVDRPMWRFRSA